MDVDIAEVDDDDDDEMPKTIPPDLLTRLLHEFFEKEGTRISKDANAAVAKYMDVFVRETIARTALEKDSGFLEVRNPRPLLYASTTPDYHMSGGVGCF